MPMYEYECEKCGKVIDRIVSSETAETPIECPCELDAKANRIHKIYRPGHLFNGSWYKNNQGY